MGVFAVPLTFLPKCLLTYRFYTYNLLSKSEMVNSLISSSLLRNAGIGVVASFVSDTFVNSLRGKVSVISFASTMCV